LIEKEGGGGAFGSYKSSGNFLKAALGLPRGGDPGRAGLVNFFRPRVWAFC